MARLIFYPVHPDGDSLRVTEYIKIEVHFNIQPGASAGFAAADDPIIAGLRSRVINPGQVEPSPPGMPAPMEKTTLATQNTTAAVEVSQQGLFAISYEELSGAGFPLAGVDPRTLHLLQDGKEIPLEWEGDADQDFEPGERLLFYAQPRFSRWTNSDVYFLTQSSELRADIQTRSADPSGLQVGVAMEETTAEQNKIYTPDCYCAPIPPGRDGDRWVWDELKWPDSNSANYTLSLPDAQVNQPATLTVWLIGYTDVSQNPDHLVQVSLNGTLLGELSWDGKKAIQEAFEIQASTLKVGENTLSLALSGISGVSVEGAWLDAFSIRYAGGGSAVGNAIGFSGEATPHAYGLQLAETDELRAYDVTEPLQPARLEGFTTGPGGAISLGDGDLASRRYWVTAESGIFAPEKIRLVSTLHTGDISGAEYLVIAPEDFIPALADLVALRQGQGLSVGVEAAQAIYDTYGDGRPDPEAIRSYLKNAYDTWDPRPLYVLLAGDGTSDPKHYLPSSSETYIPPYLADVDPWAGETAADNRYATLDGEDNLPDLLIGRLPANSPGELETIVDKIVQYESNPELGIWQEINAFVADDADSAGDFPQLSDIVMEDFANSPSIPLRFYYSLGNTTDQEIRDDLLAAWNAGARVLMFTGHASIHQWAAEQFFHLDDAVKLANSGKLPLVIELTCFTGSFQVPGFATLDETLLRQPNGGAIAVWGPTGLGISTGHSALALGLVDELSEDGSSLGSAVLAGKLRLAEEIPVFPDLIDTYTLLGDPAIHIVQPSGSESIFMPLIHNR
jgi:hypothetical protein